MSDFFGMLYPEDEQSFEMLVNVYHSMAHNDPCGLNFHVIIFSQKHHIF